MVITTDTDIEKALADCYVQLNANIFENLDAMDRFLKNNMLVKYTKWNRKLE